jgi:hypothetical protein
MMLSFEVIDSGQTIQILCDQQGLETLIGALEKLRGTADHIHLRSPSNGGRELSEQTPWGHEAIGEVIIGTGGD